MTLLMPFIYLLLISISLMIILKIEFCLSVPITILLSSITVMVSGYFGNLKIGVFVNLILVLIATILLTLKKRSIKYFLSINNLIVLIVFILFFLYVGYYFKYSHFTWFDDFSHWGPMVKGMTQYDKLYCYLPINNDHPEYPPLVQCFEYIWCYLSGGYAETSVFRALSVFTFFAFFPIFELLKDREIKNQIIGSLIITIIIMLLNVIPYVYMSSYLISIYLDFTVASFFGVTMFLIIYYDYKGNLHLVSKFIISLYLSSLLLLKEICVAFYIMLIFTILLMYKYVNKKEMFKDVLIYIFIPLFFFLSWKNYAANIIGQFNLGKIDIIESLSAFLFNKGTEFSLLIKDNFIDSLLARKMINNVNMSFIIICFICFILLLFLSTKLYKKNYKKIIIFNIIYILGVIGYIFTMYALYINNFSVEEALVLASFDRYFAIYIHFSIVLIILICSLLVSYNKLKIIPTLLIELLLFGVIIKSNYKKLLIRQPLEENNKKWTQLINQIENINFNKDKKLLIFTYDDNYLVSHKLRYEYLDNTNIKGFNLFSYYKEHQFKDEKEFIDLYKDFDYVYVYDSGEELWKVWKKTKNDGLYNNRLYKVEDKKLKLLPWANPID